MFQIIVDRKNWDSEFHLNTFYRFFFTALDVLYFNMAGTTL